MLGSASLNPAYGAVSHVPILPSKRWGSPIAVCKTSPPTYGATARVGWVERTARNPALRVKLG